MAAGTDFCKIEAFELALAQSARLGSGNSKVSLHARFGIVRRGW
jgi:hypothetical protein